MKLKFGTKLLLILVTIVTISLIVLIGVTSYFYYENSNKEAKKYVETLSKEYTTEVKASLDESILIAKQIATRINEQFKYGKFVSKQDTIDYLRDTLVNAKNLQGTWIDMKKTIIFDKKQEFDTKEVKNSYDSFNVFSPYVQKLSSGKLVPTHGSGFDMKFDWIYGPKETKKEFIAKPYIYDNILMSIIAYPIFYKNDYKGSVGTIFALDQLNEKIKKLKVFKTGYVSIIDGNCDLLAYRKGKYLGKNLFDIPNTKKQVSLKQLCRDIKNGKNSTFINKANNTYNFSHVLRAGATDTFWSVLVTVPKDEFLEESIYIRNLSIVIGLIILMLMATILLITSKILSKNINAIKDGLNDFFSFLNRASDTTSTINIKSTDEFGQMAKQINDNIEITKNNLANIKEEEILIKEVTTVVNDVKDGYFSKRVTATIHDKAFLELKELLNSMLDSLESLVGKDINKIQNTLLEYSKGNFIPELEKNSGTIGDNITELNNIITTMLQNNKNGGIQLENSSKKLAHNVQTINLNATNQATSLEETAASIEEITGNIKNTNEKAQEMLDISQDTKSSAQKGKDLASQTALSMERIDQEVTSINEAITVIDQIAFQTNILSLNAAVEAATAGEAGKGFAVVAQEVRNLANRSAEAAKEIKNLVETATEKAHEGKKISSTMIEGFTQLEEKITTTNNLINDVSNAAKEQSIGMSQIADAINSLDKFTQENALIADKTNIISNETHNIAVELVKKANESQFRD